MSKYRNRYRVESARLRGWDYRTPAWYFVTICTLERVCFFGRIRNGTMCRSPAGEIAAEEWVRTEAIRPEVRLDEWTVMPNHIHGIIVIQAIGGSTRDPSAEAAPLRGALGPKRRTGTTDPQTASRLHAGSLGAILGQFKQVCTKRIRPVVRPDFGWQDRFHDHIIRDEEALRRIRRYIRENPARWPRDRLYRL